MREQFYKNAKTGACTKNHKVAMDWYRERNPIEVWYYSETLRQWVKGVEWVW